jgi:DNA-binding response OmpR family regulator
MDPLRVLIVEDEILIALDVESALVSAGYDICGVASSEAEALSLADTFRPAFAVVDVSLSPGDGRVVAKELVRRYGVTVLFASGQCRELDTLRGTGAAGCMPKPFRADDIPAALAVAAKVRRGKSPGRLPDNMIAFA